MTNQIHEEIYRGWTIKVFFQDEDVPYPLNYSVYKSGVGKYENYGTATDKAITEAKSWIDDKEEYAWEE